jgi:hypothetical protein
MKPRNKIAVRVGVAACLVAALAQAQYTYTVGPNYVNMSGSRCRELNDNNAFTHGNGQSSVAVWSGTLSVICPFTRRSTATYGHSVGGLGTYKLTATEMTIRAGDFYAQGSTDCQPFATNTDGSIYSGTIKYVCATAGGCSTAPTASWTGTNTITWTTPLPAALTTYNWGLYCHVGQSSTVYWYEAVVSPNL